MTTGPALQNAFSVNVEDWFQGEVFARAIPREQWDQLSSRVLGNVLRLLDLLAKRRVSATFFVLGWIADRHPAMVRSIAEAGHEIASLGYSRVQAPRQTPVEFRDDLICAKALLEDLTGRAVNGYRAPDFSVGLSTPWAHAIMAECGYRYSSSVYPIRYESQGVPNSPRFPYRPHQAVLEIPLSTVRIGSHTCATPSGDSFRLYPYRLTQWALARLNQDEGAAAIFHCRPWEIDADQPRVRELPRRGRIRHYFGRARTLDRLDHLLGDFKWGRIDDTYAGDIFGVPLAQTPIASQPVWADQRTPLLTLR